MKKIAFIAGVLTLLTFTIILSVSAQQKMSKDEWQTQMANAKARITELQAQLSKLEADAKSLQEQSAKLDADIRACEDALYAMIGVTREEVEAFERELSEMDRRVTQMEGMSKSELMQYRSEIERMSNRLKEMAKSNVTKIPRYADRVRSMQDRVMRLWESIGLERTYTVGTWSRDRDCLWNIAKKRDIYANAWLWPKIWQGNRDKIKDPDIIQPKWVLKIPQGKELTQEERSAANRYYRRKAASAPASSQ